MRQGIIAAALTFLLCLCATQAGYIYLLQSGAVIRTCAQSEDDYIHQRDPITLLQRNK